jgi:hypothetical protein
MSRIITQDGTIIEGGESRPSDLVQQDAKTRQ